jgi:hypothetical protein
MKCRVQVRIVIQKEDIDYASHNISFKTLDIGYKDEYSYLYIDSKFHCYTYIVGCFAFALSRSASYLYVLFYIFCVYNVY